MTGAAAVSAIIVIAARFILRKTNTPKWMLCALWLVVLFRMACPTSLSTGASVFNMKLFHNIDVAYDNAANAYVKEGRAAIEGSDEYEAALDSGVKPMDVVINGNDMGFKAVYYLTDEYGRLSNTPTMLERYGGYLVTIWLAVAALLFAYCIISWALLKRKLRFAILLEGNVYETDAIKTSLVLGFIAPKIYLASGMTQEEKEVVLEHERTHIRRMDHALKPIFHLGCCLHWFNPVCWISYMLLCADIEIACDEAVIRRLGEGVKADYGEILVNLSSRRNILIPTVPLSFGESAVRNRVENVMRARVSTKIATCFAAAVCVFCITISGTNATNAFDPVKAAYGSQLMIEYGVWASAQEVRYLTEIESFLLVQPPELYYDDEFTNRVRGSMYSSDPGLGITTEHPVGGTYTFSSDLSEDDGFFIRAPLAEFRGKIDPVTAVFDSQGKAFAAINGEPWMELTAQFPEDGEVSAKKLTVDIEFLIDGLYPLISTALTLQDGLDIGIVSTYMDGEIGNYRFTSGVIQFNILEILVDIEGVSITFTEAAECIVETAEPMMHWR